MGLTDDQRTKLDALIAELATLPTPELINESARLRCPLPIDETGKKRLRLAFTGGASAQKIISYLEMLDGVDHIRGEIGRDIFRLRERAKALYEQESLDAAESAIMSGHLVGLQDVSFHFFAVCVGRIERFLPLAAKAAGYKVPKADRDILRPYRKLRDYYEHLEDRLPGGECYDPAVSEVEEDGQWYIRFGLDLDHLERLVIDGHTVDVSPRGVTTVRDVLRRNWEQLPISALALVRKHFENDPSYIPHPTEVRQDFLAALEIWDKSKS